MRQALELAKQGEGKASPNPMVGCVAVKDGRVIATGFHERYGGFHAERNALQNCAEDPVGAELYVNLEPCCHYGKTPPCTEIIIEKKIKKVYVGCLDSNPKVAGQGVQILREHGISVETGILEPECRALNEVFFHYMEHKQPFAAMKYAMTLDGKIACETGDSKWITGEESRAYVQRLRSRYRGIMAGIGTVLADDPMLNCRMEGGRNPVRIICDSRLRIPMDSQIVKTAPQIETIVAFAPQMAEQYRTQPGTESLEETKRKLEQQGITLLEIPVKEAHISETSRENLQAADMPETSRENLRAVDMPEASRGESQAMGLPENPAREQKDSPQMDLSYLFQKLAERNIDSILLEGGGTLNASALQEGLIQRIYAFIAPKLVAGATAKSPVEGNGIPLMRDAIRLKDTQLIKFGEDFCITGRVQDRYFNTK